MRGLDLRQRDNAAGKGHVLSFQSCENLSKANAFLGQIQYSRGNPVVVSGVESRVLNKLSVHYALSHILALQTSLRKTSASVAFPLRLDIRCSTGLMFCCVLFKPLKPHSFYPIKYRSSN
ncbi:hypothetical protein STEG23_000526 [Scotinomys teguina]